VVGIGFIAQGLIIEMSRMEREFFFPAVVVYRDIDKLYRCLDNCERIYKIRICNSPEDVNQARKNGEIAAIKNYQLAFEANIDIVADLTGDAAYGAEIAYETIKHHCNIVASPEIDICLGHFFSNLADQHNVVYSGFSGDEPGEIRNLYSYVKMTALDIIAVGKFKNYINRYANPTSVQKWADLYQQNPIKLSSFADGTKMNIEMGITANALGLVPDVPGMNSPEGSLDTVTELIRLKEDGGILSKKGVIEIVRNVEPTGGVFVIGYTTNKALVSDLKYYKMGNGPYYLFYKPYHLCAFEMLMGIAKNVVFKSSVIKPLKEKKCDVLVYAKKDLKAGDTLDEIGGYTYYGLLEDIKEVSVRNYLPVSLATGCILKKDIQKDELITLKDVEFNEQSILWTLLSTQYKR
jgi:predicted homoserine dehydrogenase-like protein